MQSRRKICKIMQEFMLFLLQNNNEAITIDLNQNEKQTIISFEILDYEENFIQEILEKVKGDRQYEVEEYGWELLGESGEEIELISALIDFVEVERYEDKAIIRLIRQENY